MLTLERRQKLWDEGNLLELLAEGTAIQDRIASTDRKSDINDISKKFKVLIQKGEVNAALKLLTNNMSRVYCRLNDDTLLTHKREYWNVSVSVCRL